MSSNENIILSAADFSFIGQVAKHCDLPKLSIASSEAQDFDAAELFCPNWEALAEIIEEVKAYEVALAAYEALEEPAGDPPVEPENYADKVLLVYGGTYEDGRGIKVKQIGLIRTLAYYAYARYVVLNGFNDTPSGAVSKSNDFSIPKSLKELEMFADKYRSMGQVGVKSNLKYLCFKRDIFTTFIPGNLCTEYDCGTEDCERTNTKGTGLRGSNITKRL